MMLGKKSLSMAESQEFINNDSGAEVGGFIKKFVKMTPAKAKELRKKLESLDMLKMKEEHIAKLIDIQPETQEDVNKIFNDVGLDKDESQKILDTIKEFK